MTALAYELAEHLGKFRTDSTPEEKKNGKEARYPVLSYLVLRANKRNRAFPKIDKIAKDTGYGRQRVIEALAWLEKRGAISEVPRHLRIGDEKKAHFNNAVYQLSGFIKLCGETIRYLHMSKDEKPETSEDLPDENNLTVSTENVPTETNQLVRKTKTDQYDKRKLVSTTNVHPSLYERNQYNDSKEQEPPTPSAITNLEGVDQHEKTAHERGGGIEDGSKVIPISKRDVVFDALAVSLFKVDLQDKAEVSGHSGRVVALKKKLKGMYPNTPDDRLAQKIIDFPAWYHAQPETKTASLPLGTDTFPGHFSKFIKSLKTTPNYGDPDPNCPDCSGRGWWIDKSDQYNHKSITCGCRTREGVTNG